MTGVTICEICPICGGPMEAYLDTRTRQTDDYCQGACGYSAHQKLHHKSSTGLDYWVETQFLPMSKDGRVARPDGQHKWNNNEFPSADSLVETVLVLVYLNADPLTGNYTMTTDVAGNKTAPPIVWELGLLQLSARDLWQLRMLPGEGKDWHSVDYSVTLGEDGGKQLRRVSHAPRWKKNPLVQAVEADRLATDFRPAVLVPEKGRAIRFAILKPQIGQEIGAVF